jgi:hypothetical protein
MSIVLVGSTSGSVTLQEPAVAGTTVLDLPAVSGTILTTGSSGQSIPKAALPTGSVLQVVSVNSTSAQGTTTSTSFVASSLSASITPTSSSSKIFILVTSAGYTTSTNTGYFTIYRGASNLGGTFGFGGFSTNNSYDFLNMSILDSPATTSSTTYTVYYKTDANTVALSDNNLTSSMTLMEIAA